MIPINHSIPSLGFVPCYGLRKPSDHCRNPAGSQILLFKYITLQVWESKWHTCGDSKPSFTGNFKVKTFVYVSFQKHLAATLYAYSIDQGLSFHFSWLWMKSVICPRIRHKKIPFKLFHMQGKSFVQNQYISVRLKALHGKLTHMRNLKYFCSWSDFLNQCKGHAALTASQQGAQRESIEMSLMKNEWLCN